MRNTTLRAMKTGNGKWRDLVGAIAVLPITSVVNFSQIVTVDKSYFISLVSMVPKTMLEKIVECIKVIFEVR